MPASTRIARSTDSNGLAASGVACATTLRTRGSPPTAASSSSRVTSPWRSAESATARGLVEGKLGRAVQHGPDLARGPAVDVASRYAADEHLGLHGPRRPPGDAEQRMVRRPLRLPTPVRHRAEQPEVA